MQLSRQQIKPYLSSYLSAGWQQDRLQIDAVDVSSDGIHGQVSVTDYFMPSDGIFHFNAPLAFIAIAQFGIIHGCWDQGLTEKKGEIYLRDIHLKCRSAVRKTLGIEILLTVLSKRPVTGGIFYAGGISIEDDAFVGEATYILPLPSVPQIAPAAQQSGSSKK